MPCRGPCISRAVIDRVATGRLADFRERSAPFRNWGLISLIQRFRRFACRFIGALFLAHSPLQPGVSITAEGERGSQSACSVNARSLAQGRLAGAAGRLSGGGGGAIANKEETMQRRPEGSPEG